MLQDLLKKARAMAASDLHLAVNSIPMVRVDGNLFPIGKLLTTEMLNAYIEQLLTTETKAKLQANGEVDFAYVCQKERYRVNIFQANEEYAIAIRLISNIIPSCMELGLTKVVQDFVAAKHGLVLATGPTGSGKSTTLAALVQKLNVEKSLHIITLEEPIEYLYEQSRSMINQREVGKDTLSYASGLKNALREDPDVILVGELRDAEALRTALQAAETGHLVLSTLHTRDAVTTINRILDMLPQEREQVRAQLADSLVGIISQELLQRKDGKGRVAALELLVNNNAVSNLIREGRTHQLYSYMQTGSRLGMQTLAQSLAGLRRTGVIN